MSSEVATTDLAPSRHIVRRERISQHTAHATWLPVKLAFIDGRAYLHRNYIDLGGDVLGTRVLSINGRRIEMIVDDLFPPHVFGRTGQNVKIPTVRRHIDVGGLFSTAYGWTTQFKLQLQLLDGSTQIDGCFGTHR